jgi:hypothetical protein
VALLVTAELPKYQQIAERVLHLNQLRLNNGAAARHIGVDGKTVAKALRWIRGGFQENSRGVDEPPFTSPMIRESDGRYGRSTPDGRKLRSRLHGQNMTGWRRSK